MRLLIAGSVLCIAALIATVEYTDGFNRSLFRSGRGYVSRSISPVTAEPQEENYVLDQAVRPAGLPSGLSRWNVLDAFPETSHLGGAMQMRSHPSKLDTWYVATFHGRVFEVSRGSESVTVRKVIDLSSKGFGWLYSIALHPRFDRGTPHIYLFSRSSDSANQKYFRVSFCPVADSRVSGESDERVLIEQSVEHYEHLGGGLDFDDEGFLLIGVGDNGLYDDKSEHSQKIHQSLFSGILRIDVDRLGGTDSFASRRLPIAARTGGYFVPANNPFVGRQGAIPEFWAVGFRNPFRLHFDTVSRIAWVGEVGQDRIEQLEAARAGTNHMWSFREGSEVFPKSYLRGKRPSSLIGEATLPFFEYRHRDQNYCIVGGPVYRSHHYPELTGRVLFGDNQSGRLWAIDSKDPTKRLLLTRLPTGKKHASLTSICVDVAGRIFLTSFASGDDAASVHELVPVDPVDMPPRLSDAGFVQSIQPFKPTAEFIRYEVNSPLWSDGMRKTRWFSTPAGTKIDNAGDEFEHWNFPIGSVFIKHFENPKLICGQANTGAIETRVLVRGENGSIYGATYRWNEAKTDATLVGERQQVSVSVIPDGAETNSDLLHYRFPSPNDCLVCHNRGHQSLGLTAAQLNRDAVEVNNQNQLLYWSEKGLLLKPYQRSDVAAITTLSALQDETVSIAHRARSYLHSNCSFCHHERGTQRTEFTASLRVPLQVAKIVGHEAKTFYMEIDGRRTREVVRPGAPGDSLLYRRLITHQAEYAMPYLGRSSVDREAAGLIRRWIEQLE